MSVVGRYWNPDTDLSAFCYLHPDLPAVFLLKADEPIPGFPGLTKFALCEACTKDFREKVSPESDN